MAVLEKTQAVDVVLLHFGGSRDLEEEKWAGFRPLGCFTHISGGINTFHFSHGFFWVREVGYIPSLKLT